MIRQNSEPGWITFGSGINIPDPQHCQGDPTESGSNPDPDPQKTASIIIVTTNLEDDDEEENAAGDVHLEAGENHGHGAQLTHQIYHHE